MPHGLSAGDGRPSTLDRRAGDGFCLGRSRRVKRRTGPASGEAGSADGKPEEPPPLAEENVLRNEFFEVRFDPHTGCDSVDLRLSQPRSPAWPSKLPCGCRAAASPGPMPNYSIMAADELAVTSAGPVLGEIVSRGRLMDREGRRVAGFRQTTRARRGSRVIEIQIELDIERQPGANPWDSYYAARFAWKDEAASLHRSANMANLPTELNADRIAPFSRHPPRQAADDAALRRAAVPSPLRTAEARHAVGRSRRDGQLVPAGHRHRRAASDGGGVGRCSPPPLVLPDQPPPPTPSGWLFHLDCRNVLATHWEPLAASRDSAASRVSAFACWKPTAAACNLGFAVSARCGRRERSTPATCRRWNLVVEGDRINIPIGPHQWIEVEACFHQP